MIAAYFYPFGQSSKWATIASPILHLMDTINRTYIFYQQCWPPTVGLIGTVRTLIPQVYDRFILNISGSCSEESIELYTASMKTPLFPLIGPVVTPSGATVAAAIRAAVSAIRNIV